MAKHYLVLLILALFVLYTKAKVFESINCGASGTYEDENSIVWNGDSDFKFSHSKTATIQAKNFGISQVMTTLRFFTGFKKNCYTIDATKGEKVLIRASFFYGSYDGKSIPPRFDLHLDGNFWATVENELDKVVYYDIVYVVRFDSLSVCVAQTHKDQFPFISALEFRGLGSEMYSDVDDNVALIPKKTFAFGASNTIRYPSDSYDRIWVPPNVDGELSTVMSDATFIDTSGTAENIPEAALRNAITTSTTSEYIILNPSAEDKPVPVYIIMYFSEVTQLDSTQTRSFNIYIDDKISTIKPVIPAYGAVTSVYFYNMTASRDTNFSLVATSDSTLPPLINAMEVFYVTDPVTDGTDSNDVNGLSALQSSFSVLQEWTSDPCLPSPYTWEWVNCSSASTPHVTALYLAGFDLSGELPDFSAMDALETIDLHGNNLSGKIPGFLGSLPNLKELNLADNDFSGPIPDTISTNKKLKLTVSGNKNLCVSGEACRTSSSPKSSSASSGKKKSKVPIILGTIIPIFVLFWVIVGVLFMVHHKRKTAAIAALATGNASGVNGTPQIQNGGKIGEVVMNEIRVHMEDQVANTTNGDQYNLQDQQRNNG